MNTTPFNFGIVGTGMIANVIANALAQSASARLRAVSSRQLPNAQKFIADRPGAEAVEGLAALLGRADIDAIYFAIPSVAKEAAVLASIAAGKHVLVEKPFVSLDSARRMTEAAAAKGVLFMDATHFVHHPRTAAIQSAICEKIGVPRTLHTTFYFPFPDGPNIRFDPAQEPLTALGDLGWYSMRAVVEYLRPAGSVAHAVTVPMRDPRTGAIMQASGLIAFASGETATFDIGFTAGTVLMDLQLTGTTGVLEMDDFVLDWENSWPFKNPTDHAGYFHRTGMASRHERTFIATPASTPAEVSMVENFAALASGDEPGRFAFAAASLKTQEYLDALWRVANA
ncbi:MAG TPA: Gfo/Idh/MocA family oxidoreductase [Chthoniobacteraceae bacterium]|jgi:predicted dehydrogenase|nr:Gfo/Idh/MocA family oxidoreductase [Chthoniobacteraceae bacterium]